MLYASVGAELTGYFVDTSSATLTRRGSTTLPAGVQYVWPHPKQPLVYVASSNGGPGQTGDRHHLSAFRMAANSGALTAHGEPLALPARPIHFCLDRQGGHALTAYNNPSMVTVHRIGEDGTIGAEVPQPAGLDAGIYAHHILVTPSNRAAILVARGNDAAGDKPENPGALKLFGFEGGVLSDRALIAPGGGYGFGPRHLDFHPSKPYVFVSIERQNQLHVYGLGPDDTLTPEPLFVASTLADPEHRKPRQLAGGIHVHPNGRFVYVSNRSDATIVFKGQRVRVGGEDNIAVFQIDSVSGAPRLIQNANPRTSHVRTFSIDPSGRVMVTASIHASLKLDDNDDVQNVPAALSVFRIGPDGQLDFQRKYDIDTSAATMFWSGTVAVG
ncbi:MAG: 3-carboxymuconate cyclase [Alphaproteobacteria bacterium]|nr:3-carboxymuconate cyclase [Alphaproteobacteria bacterium]